MLGLLAKVIPLDLASTLSPGIFALAIYLLGSKYHPYIRIISFFAGILLIGIGITIAGFAVGAATPNVAVGESTSSAIVDLILGLVLIVFGIHSLSAKERKAKPATEKGSQVFKWVIIGIIIAVTNLDAAFLNFTAAKEVSDSTAVDSIEKIIILIVNLIFFTLPITLPFLITVLFPSLKDKILPKLNEFVTRYSKYIIFVMLVGFGIYLAYKGIAHFL